MDGYTQQQQQQPSFASVGGAGGRFLAPSTAHQNAALLSHDALLGFGASAALGMGMGVGVPGEGLMASPYNTSNYGRITGVMDGLHGTSSSNLLSTSQQTGHANGVLSMNPVSALTGTPVSPGVGLNMGMLAHHSAGVSTLPSSLYVKNLPYETDKLFLYERFSPFGAILSVKVLLDSGTGKCRGVGFINFADHAAAVHAIQALHGTKVGDKLMHVSLQTPRVRTMGAYFAPGQLM